MLSNPLLLLLDQHVDSPTRPYVLVVSLDLEGAAADQCLLGERAPIGRGLAHREIVCEFDLVRVSGRVRGFSARSASARSSRYRSMTNIAHYNAGSPLRRPCRDGPRLTSAWTGRHCGRCPKVSMTLHASSFICVSSALLRVPSAISDLHPPSSSISVGPGVPPSSRQASSVHL